MYVLMEKALRFAPSFKKCAVALKRWKYARLRLHSSSPESYSVIGSILFSFGSSAAGLSIFNFYTKEG